MSVLGNLEGFCFRGPDPQHFRDTPLEQHCVLDRFPACWSRKTLSGKFGIIFSVIHLRALDRILAPDGRARRQDFDKREARAVPLDLERFADRPPRFHDVLVVRKRHAFDVCRRFQCGKQFRHVQRETFVRRPPAPGRSCALLPDQGGWRHLSARHAVNSVVHEKDGDLLAAVGGMHDLGGADGRQVAVSLIGNDDLVRAGSFDSRGRSGRAAVRGLHIAYVKIVVGKHRTAHRTHEDRLVLQPEFLQGFGNQLVHDAVSAAGTVVGLVLQLGLALVQVKEHRRLGVDRFVCVVVNIGAGFGLASDLTSDYHCGFNFGSTTVITFSFAIFVVLFGPDPRLNWSQTATAMRDNTCSCSSRTEGTLPPPRP